MVGRPPFWPEDASDRDALFQLIMETEPANLEDGTLSAEASTVIQGLLTKDPEQRLGVGSRLQTLKDSSFFGVQDWTVESLMARDPPELELPDMPALEDHLALRMPLV